MEKIRGLLRSPLKAVLLVGLAAGFAALGGPGGITRVDAGVAFPTTIPMMPGCYAGNQYVYDGLTGTTYARGNGHTSFAQSEYEATPSSSGSDYGGGTMQWIVRGAVTGPDADTQTGMSGNLRLEVHFANGKVMTFTTRCAAEVQTEAENVIEMEFEGTVKGFPNHFGNWNAVVTVQMSPSDLGGYNAKFSVEIGSTCFENGAEIGFGTAGDASDPGAYLRVENVTKDVGRWGFPNGYDSSTCIDAG